MSPERAGYASMERTRSFHEEGGKGKEEGGGGSYVSIPGRFSSVSTRDFRCSSANSPGQWNRRLALRAMKVKEGVDVEGDVYWRCVATDIVSVVWGVNTLGVKRIEWDKGGYRW